MKYRDSIVYIVDDDASVCRAISLLLKPHGFKVQTFTRGADFLSCKLLKTSSCLILDVRLPDTNGLAFQEALAQKGIHIPVIFLTGHGDIAMGVEAMKAGAVDFFPKPVTEKKLISAIGLALARNKTDNKKKAEASRIQRRLKTLTPRELQVFRLVAKGLLNKQIARKLGTTLQTVKIHRGRATRKMQARSVSELIHLAQKSGLVH